MRRLSALVAVLGLFLTVTACGGGGGEPSGPVSIEFWHTEPAANEDTLERMVSRFNASQEEVRVRAVYQGSPDELVTKLVGAAGSGEVPAAAFLTEGFIQRMIDSGIAVPAQQFVDEEDYQFPDLDAKLLAYHTAEDTLWPVPLCVDTPLLYYNKSAFRDAGLDPEDPPADLEELREYSRQLLTNSSGGTTGLALDIKLWFEQALAKHGDLLVNQNNGRDGRATEVLFNSEAGHWVFQWWQDMVDEGLAINVGRNPTGADSFLAVATDRAAMTYGYAGALRSLVNALEQGATQVEVGVGPVPGPPDGAGGSLLLGHAGWMFDRPEREQRAAWSFLKWMTEPEQQAEWFAGSGCMPVNRSAVDQPAAQEVLTQYPGFQVALDQYLGAPDSPAALAAVAGPLPAIRETIFAGIEAMLSGELEPDQALERAAERANEELADYNRRVPD
jgi:sn-glycerol 3-phosphate transport system substrate-binding protein